VNKAAKLQRPDCPEITFSTPKGEIRFLGSGQMVDTLRAAVARYNGNRTGQMKVGKCVLSEKQTANRGLFSKHLLRLREIERVIEARHGLTVPETDDGDLYIEAAAHALNAHCKDRGGDLDQMLTGWCSRWAPWARPRAGVVLRPILNKLVRRIYDLRADAVAILIQVTYSERQMLELATIGACDVPRHIRRSMAKARKREIDRQRQAEIRRQQGRQPRASFLAANRISRLKPWLALNISRRTWYRRFGTSPSLLENIIIGDTPVPTVRLGARLKGLAHPLAEGTPSSKAQNGSDNATSVNDDAEPYGARIPRRMGGASG